jgi:DNA-binding NarL/FixJ family response regulator
MTAGRQHSTQQRRTGRIIARPRLIKQLDESDAPVILLIGPAGYGKTTLARQWARTLSGVIWVSCTPSHRDVVTFAEDVAAGIDALGGNASRFIGEYMRARSNPQRAAREIGRVLAERTREVSLQWLIVDDYQEIAEAPEVEAIISALRERITSRMLVASRLRPRWATARESVYGQTNEIGPAELALTAEETSLVLGRRPDLDVVVQRAKGWPAVVALASGLDATEGPRVEVPETLHRYVADELFRSASLTLQDDLMNLALVPSLGFAQLSTTFGEKAINVLHEAQDLGFVTGDPVELHPLLREFLFTKLADDPLAADRVKEAIDQALVASAWEHALALVLRFVLRDRVDQVLREAYKPLVRSGRLGTLENFAAQVRGSPGFPPAVIDLVDSEVAFRDGQFTLAVHLARRAQRRLPKEHPLLSRTYALEAQCHNFHAAYPDAFRAFVLARDTSQDEADETEALHGMVSAKSHGDLGSADDEVALLRARRHDSPLQLIRCVSAEANCRLFGDGLRGDLGLDEAFHSLNEIEDPRTRSSLTYLAANVLAFQTRYQDALYPLKLFGAEVREFGLDFALPYLGCTGALINLGLRRYGDADRHIQAIEDASADTQHHNHSLNARILRARLLLQTGEAGRALEYVAPENDDITIPLAWEAEYRATRALALACTYANDAASELAHEAAQMSRSVYVRICAAAALATASAHAKADDEAIDSMITQATDADIWDPVLIAVRSSETLFAAMDANPAGHHSLVQLAGRAGDTALARRLGIRARATRAPGEILSPRELEVLGLMAQGRRNREIAAALFIAESTVKVHVRHILERLGVRTRAEAVARYERLQRTP